MRSYLLPSPDLPPTDVPLYRPGGVTVGGGGPQVLLPRGGRPSVTISPGAGRGGNGGGNSSLWGGGVVAAPANWTSFGYGAGNYGPGAGPTAVPTYWGPSNGQTAPWREGGAGSVLTGGGSGGGSGGGGSSSSGGSSYGGPGSGGWIDAFMARIRNAH